MEYREERKYFCSDYDMTILMHRLRAILPYDIHQQDGCYTIRSLYFDTSDNQCFYENEAGVDNRKKYRIRTYNNSDQKIQFEVKEKRNGKTKKSSFPLTRRECESLMHGEFISCPEDSSVLNQVFLAEHLHLLHPAVTVEYERTAFTYPIGNVRITFDRNISACPNTRDFFADHPLKYPAMPWHEHVLEVKYDELLPGFIAQALELNNLRLTSCSKYYLGRKACDVTNIL